MDMNFTAAEIAFRDEVRAFLKNALPNWLSAKVKSGKRLKKQDRETWHAALNDRGWLASAWPVEHGGPGWTPVQKHIFEGECVAAGAPGIVPFGLAMFAPVLIKFGSDRQKAYYLPRILSGEDWWCQGYSEPGAGSDLASLKTRAIRDGDHYVVNGQKTWTTLGHYANRMFCLVKTDTRVKPQDGISFLLVDMESPGVTVRPIVTLDGEHEVNEVFLDNVRVPVRNLVGEENKGWTYAKYLLTHERTGIAGVAFAKQGMAHLKRVAQDQKKDGRPLAHDPLFAARMAQVEIDLMAMETFNLRVVSAAAAGGAPGVESSLLKIKGTVIRQEITDLLRRAVGPYALPFTPEAFEEGYNQAPIGPDYAGPVASAYFNMRKLSIYGGSNEIQKNIVAKQMLRL
ncbi:MAG: acyl-CoA dehydrogenase family protein [Rhodospirillales bacterium]|nr:acyl-CoA dehydrogenase family protein [Rhodospirillales bacterium]